MRLSGNRPLTLSVYDFVNRACRGGGVLPDVFGSSMLKAKPPPRQFGWNRCVGFRMGTLVQQMAGAGGRAGPGSPGGNPWPLAMSVLAAQLRRFVWLIVAAALIFGIAAVFARILIPKTYQATVQVL